MTKYIRRAAALCALLLLALLVNATRVQVFQSRSYDDNPANRRPAIARWGQPRGNIMVEGRPVTGSKDTGEQLRFERTYRDGPLYAPVTGFASQVYGTSFLEHAEDSVLDGSSPMLSFLPCGTTSPATRTPAARSSRPSRPRPSARPTWDSAPAGARSPRSNRPPGASWRWSPGRRTTPECSPATAPRWPRRGRG